MMNAGISIAVRQGYYEIITPRSGFAAKKFINVGVCAIDVDYWVEVRVVLFNHSDEGFKVKPEDHVF